jgi:hypothetical protein
MSTFVGTSGNVKVGASPTPVAEMDQWELTVVDNLNKITKFGQAWKTQTSGIREWSGKFGGRWDMTDVNGQATLQTVMTGTPALVQVELDIDGTHHYSGSVWIKQIQIKQVVEGVATADFDFDGDGTLTAV